MAIDYVRGVFSRHTLSPNRVKRSIHSAPMGNLIKVKGTAMGPLQGDPAWSGGTQTA